MALRTLVLAFLVTFSLAETDITSSVTQTSTHAPGYSIRLPGSGVGSWRKISLSGEPSRYSRSRSSGGCAKQTPWSRVVLVATMAASAPFIW